MFSMFDKLLLLANGRMCYFGDAAEAVPFFSSQGFVCPLAVNPAEYVSESGSRCVVALSASTDRMFGRCLSRTQ